MKQDRSFPYKNKILPCNKKDFKEEMIKRQSRVNKRSPSYIRRKISSSIATKVKKAGLCMGVEYSKYINIFEMMVNIELQFDENMSWENYGVYWDIDHIIPQCLFDFTDIGQVRLCWSIGNVRPMVREENALKADTVDMALIREYNLQYILQRVI